MTSTERLIGQIVAASRIPSEKRRRDIVRELRAHLEDSFENEERSGHGEEDIERMLWDQFGDAEQIARQFAWVYRRERALWHFAGFLLSTFVVSLVIAAAALPLQAGVLLGFGVPTATILESRHMGAVALDILTSAGTYLGLLTLERMVRQPLVLLSVIVALLSGLFVAAGIQANFLFFGFVNGALLRVITLHARHPVWRFLGALASFASLGALLFHPAFSALPATSASWLVMGSGYCLLTYLAERVNHLVIQRL